MAIIILTNVSFQKNGQNDQPYVNLFVNVFVNVSMSL